MKFVIYIRKGESVARIRKGRDTIQPSDEYVISATKESGFRVWQITNLLERMNANYKVALQKP